MTRPEIQLVPSVFDALPSWRADDHLAAFTAFLASCQRLTRPKPGRAAAGPDAASAPLLDICRRALATRTAVTSRDAARAFFEAHFTAHTVRHAGPAGLLTGYYEPMIAAARTRDARFTAPILRRPADLVNLVDETQRGAVDGKLTHARKTAKGLEPYATRQEIDQGALAGQGLELLYLPDAVDVFFLQVQGSGRIRFPDGSTTRVTYDGKNGHPYTSIGRHLIEAKTIADERMSLQNLGAWLRSAGQRGREVMWHNKSYVFFRELTGADAGGPIGALGVPLTEGRSLAIDTAHHALGTPIYVVAPTLTHAAPPAGFARLMIAQDVGSAIKGPERGDIYFGSGDAAGKVAGVTRHAGQFFVLLPKGGGDARAVQP